MGLIALEARVRSPRIECKEKQGGGGELEVRFRVDVDAGDPLEDMEALAEIAGRDAIITITEKHPNLKLDFAGLRPIEDRVVEVCQRLDGMQAVLAAVDADDPTIPDTPTLLRLRDSLGELRELLMPTPPKITEPNIKCPSCGHEDHVEGETLPMCGHCGAGMLPIDAKCGTCGCWKDPAWGGDGTCSAHHGEEGQVFAADTTACMSYEVPRDACPTCGGTGKLGAAGTDEAGEAKTEEVDCADCGGSGRVPPPAEPPTEACPDCADAKEEGAEVTPGLIDGEPCPRCSGTGRVSEPDAAPEAEAEVVTPEVCPKCEGAGHIPEDPDDPTSLKPCAECGGTGKPKAEGGDVQPPERNAGREEGEEGPPPESA